MKIAVLGYGTVGSGVVEVLTTNADTIEKKAGKPIEIKYVLDLRDFPGNPINELIVHDINIILSDTEIEIVAEAMGGIHPAYEFAKAALESGKSYVTSNKELVAAFGSELLEVAQKHKVNFLFEASVGGGIPIIRPLKQSLTADEVEEVTGILNGTTNFILTKMKEDGSDFGDVLSKAQALGYAEKDPTADVEGHDACRKIAILASLALGKHVNYEEVPTQGISKITKEDIMYADQMGYVIKLLGTCKKQEKGIFARVSPMFIKKNHPLPMVNDVFNAIFVRGNMVGDLMFYGRGAGKLPTASAVVGDIVDAAKHIGTNIATLWEPEKVSLLPNETVKVSYFVRLGHQDEEVAHKVAEVFKTVEEVKSLPGEYAFVTPILTEKAFEEALKELGQIKVLNQIRIQK